LIRVIVLYKGKNFSKGSVKSYKIDTTLTPSEQAKQQHLRSILNAPIREYQGGKSELLNFRLFLQILYYFDLLFLHEVCYFPLGKYSFFIIKINF
jgi:hypothetical protein